MVSGCYASDSNYLFRPSLAPSLSLGSLYCLSLERSNKSLPPYICDASLTVTWQIDRPLSISSKRAGGVYAFALEEHAAWESTLSLSPRPARPVPSSQYSHLCSPAGLFPYPTNNHKTHQRNQLERFQIHPRSLICRSIARQAISIIFEVLHAGAASYSRSEISTQAAAS